MELEPKATTTALELLVVGLMNKNEPLRSAPQGFVGFSAGVCNELSDTSITALSQLS